MADAPLPGRRVALVIPTLNEAESIGPLLRRVPRDRIAKIIVADGGSADATADRARAEGAEVILPGRGYGKACLEGAIAAGADADIVAFMDGDGSDHPEIVGDLIDPIAQGRFDFVIASRVRGVREPGSMSLHQVLAGRAIGAIVGALYGVAYTDMCAYRAIRRGALLDLGMREMTYGWNLEMQMRVARAGLRVLEIPAPYGRRTGGASKVAGSLRGTIKASTRILTTLARVALERRAADRREQQPHGAKLTPQRTDR